jgi:hypothetical protein
VRQNWIWAAVAAAGLVLFSYRTLSGHFILWGDYLYESRPALLALVSGHIGEFFRVAPAYGGSLLLRAPFVLAAKAFGVVGPNVVTPQPFSANDQALYRVSVIPVLLASGPLAWWLASRMNRGKARWLAALVVVGLCVLKPMAEHAVLLGHPEEILGAVLCVAAVLCAIHDRPVWAGVLLGLAIANKEWALLAVGPVLVALPRKRLLALGWAGAVAGAIIAPFLIAGAVNLHEGLRGVPGAETGGAFTPWQVWWFFGTPAPGLMRSPPAWIGGLTHPLIVGISIPLTLLYVLRPRGRRPAAADALLLLAFLLLLRCMLDPWDISYYSLPFLLALVAWEVLRFRRLPVIAVTATFFAWVLYVKSSDPSWHLWPPDRQSLSFLLISLPAAAALAYAVYAPGVRERLVRRAARPVNIEQPLEQG